MPSTPLLAKRPSFDQLPSSRGALFVTAMLLATGCRVKDPVWDMPCSERPAQTVEVGTGETEFIAAADAPIPIQNGSQGGQHLWLSLLLHGFGPEASLRYGIFDAADPSTVYSGPLSGHVELEYDSEAEASVALGLYGYLTELHDPDTGAPLPGPSGKDVVLWADVTDTCTTTAVHAESHGHVQ